MAERMGPYYNEGKARGIAKTFAQLGEKVRIEWSFYPCKPKAKQYEWVVIRGEGA
jgi:hypothetical protein